MKNRDKKNKQLNLKKQEKTNVSKEKEVKKQGMDAKIAIDIVALIVSALAVVLAGFSLLYAKKEYDYKIDPEVTASMGVKAEAYQVNGKNEYQIYSDGIRIEIQEKNNLERAYLIYPDNEVEKLNINEVDAVLEEELNENIKLKKYDFQYGEQRYQYRFLYLIGLDGNTELSLIYIKSGKDEMVFNGVSGIEIWGLANSHPDDPDFEGEKMMAAQYEQIIKDSEKYIF